MNERRRQALAAEAKSELLAVRRSDAARHEYEAKTRLARAETKGHKVLLNLVTAQAAAASVAPKTRLPTPEPVIRELTALLLAVQLADP